MFTTIWFIVSLVLFLIWCYWIFRPLFGFNELLKAFDLVDRNDNNWDVAVCIILLLIIGFVLSMFWWFIIFALIACLPLLGLGWILKKLFY